MSSGASPVRKRPFVSRIFLSFSGVMVMLLRILIHQANVHTCTISPTTHLHSQPYKYYHQQTTTNQPKPQTPNPTNKQQTKTNNNKTASNNIVRSIHKYALKNSPNKQKYATTNQFKNHLYSFFNQTYQIPDKRI